MGGFETKRTIDVLRGNLSLDVAPNSAATLDRLDLVGSGFDMKIFEYSNVEP